MNYANAINKLELTLKRQQAAIAATQEQITALQHLAKVASTRIHPSIKISKEGK